MDDWIRRLPLGEMARRNLLLLYYLVQLLFVLLYWTPEVQPFVYVRF